MIKSPEVPTDNLYKFLAVFGLAIFIFSVYAPISTQQTFNRSLKDWSDRHSTYLLNRAKKFSHELYLEDQLRLKELSLKSNYHQALPNIKEEEMMELLRDKPGLEKDLREYYELRLKISLLTDETSDIKRNLEERFERPFENEFLVPIAVLSFLGLMSMTVGFGLWYYKVQRFLDKELRLKATGP